MNRKKHQLPCQRPPKGVTISLYQSGAVQSNKSNNYAERTLGIMTIQDKETR